ncbi:MAG TPA: alpha/beta fold hydrolase [Conexibacter sp.]|jgi:pimeloyl-ACP methyl ester carboxylesterase
MHTRLRATAALAMAFAACFLSALAFTRGTTAAEGANATTAQAPSGALGPCTGLGDLPTARCGSVEVPLDRANPAAGTTTVAFAVLPHRDQSAPSEGTILFNPGGPGNAAIALTGEVAARFEPLLDRRDVLLVDPRGTGRSDALSCRAFRNIGLFFKPHARTVAAIGACGRELGPRGRLYNSTAVADDFDDVRAALGTDRLDLWGESYGTYLMPVYAARHPDHVRSVVLSGAYPIDFDPWGRDRLAASRRATRLVCERTRACDSRVALRDIRRLAAELRRHPVPFTIVAGQRRFPARLSEGSLAALFYTGGYPPFYGQLPAAAASALAGDTATLRRLVETSLLSTATVLFDPATASAFSLAQSFATQCHDYPHAYSYADPIGARRAMYERALRALDPKAFVPFSPAGWTQAGFEAVDTCIEWPDDPTAGSPLAPGSTLPDVPVLVLSGDLDANTPSFAGREAARQFPHATFAEIPNEGHTPTGSPCGLALGLRFVTTLAADARACVGTGTPPPVAGRAAVRAAGLPLPHGHGTRAERRAFAVVGATVTDLFERLPLLGRWHVLTGLRGGRYSAQSNGSVRLDGIRVVRDARLSGVMRPTEREVTGSVRLRGAGVPDGHLRIRLTTAGRGRAIGRLDGRSVDRAFRMG